MINWPQPRYTTVLFRKKVSEVLFSDNRRLFRLNCCLICNNSQESNCFDSLILWSFSDTGTEEERGIKQWRAAINDAESEEGKEALRVYDLPWFSDYFRNLSWTKYFPLCPNFDPRCGRTKKVEEDTSMEVKYDGHMDEVVVINSKDNTAYRRKPEQEMPATHL